jgi:hypothetical protein
MCLFTTFDTYVVKVLQGHPKADVESLNICHTLFRDRGNEASIHVPRMFHSHI